jgi:uncharacterized membrane protein YhaH (DUF805 family)
MSQLFFSFEDRMSRQPYWLASTVVTALMLLVTGIVYIVVDDCVRIGPLMLLLALFTPFIWSTMALSAKRLHDRNKSAFWLFTFYLVPPTLKDFAGNAGGIGIALGLAGTALSLWALVEIGFLRGTAGPNHYGRDPLIRA